MKIYFVSENMQKRINVQEILAGSKPQYTQNIIFTRLTSSYCKHPTHHYLHSAKSRCFSEQPPTMWLILIVSEEFNVVVRMGYSKAERISEQFFLFFYYGNYFRFLSRFMCNEQSIHALNFKNSLHFVNYLVFHIWSGMVTKGSTHIVCNYPEWQYWKTAKIMKYLIS